MRDGWKEISLEELETSGVIKLGRGDVISKKDMEADPGPNPVYSSAENKNGMIGKYAKFMFDEELITWSVDGGGHIFYRPKHKFSVTNIGGWLRILDDKVFSYQFLTYALQRLHKQHSFDWQHKAHPSVIRKLYTRIPLPSLSEQKRIVDLISSVDSYIEALQQQLESIQSIRSSISESLWSSFSLRSKLSSFGETLTGSTPPTKKQQYWESHEVDFFTPSDLGASLKLNTASRGVSIEGAAISRPLKGYSVLQVCIGATIGKVGYLNHPAVMNQQINALTNLTEHDAPILAAILSSETFQSIIRNTAGGSTLPIISKSSWGEIQIPHVPEGERIKVSLAILESDSFIEQSRQLLFSAEKLRSSILHNLLTGTHEIPVGYDNIIGAA